MAAEVAVGVIAMVEVSAAKAAVAGVDGVIGKKSRTPLRRPSDDDRKDDQKKERKDRRPRDFKRKDDDLILDPAPDAVTGFGDDVPAFLK